MLHGRAGATTPVRPLGCLDGARSEQNSHAISRPLSKDPHRSRNGRQLPSKYLGLRSRARPLVGAPQSGLWRDPLVA